MSMDYRDFSHLLQNVEKLQRNYSTFVSKFLVDMGMRALGKTKQLTPRDKGGGGGLVSKWELSSVYREGNTLCIDLFNPQEYASFVEDGHMQRAYRTKDGKKNIVPLSYFESSRKGRMLASNIRAKYGEDTEFIWLKDKWIPGHHMARIAITQVEQQIPKRYEAAFKKFLKEQGVE